MGTKLRLGIDIDNGDTCEKEGIATKRILKGVETFTKEQPNIELILYGNGVHRRSAERLIEEQKTNSISFKETNNFYNPNNGINRPVPGTSLHTMALNIQTQDNLHGIFTLCDTAKIAIELLRLRTKGLQPALVGSLPTLGGKEFVCTDLGLRTHRSKKFSYTEAVKETANATYTQALMATAYMHHQGNIQPTWGILSNGTETHKGSDIDRYLDQIVSEQMEKTPLSHITRYIGKVEPQDCFEGKADIVLTDGYKGNLYLKAAEAAVKTAEEITRQEIQNLGKLEKILLAIAQKPLKKIKQKIKQRIHPDTFGGAIMLGYKEPAVKGHGTSSTEAIYQGIKKLASFAGNTFNEDLQKIVETYQLQE